MAGRHAACVTHHCQPLSPSATGQAARRPASLATLDHDPVGMLSPRRAGSAQREMGGRSRRLQLWSPSCARGSRRARPPNQHGVTWLARGSEQLRSSSRAASPAPPSILLIRATREHDASLLHPREPSAARRASRARARRPCAPRRRREPRDPGRHVACGARAAPPPRCAPSANRAMLFSVIGEPNEPRRAALFETRIRDRASRA